MTDKTPEAVLADYVAAIAADDRDAMLGLLADDAEIWIAGQFYRKSDMPSIYQNLSDFFENGLTLVILNGFSQGEKAVVEIAAAGEMRNGNDYQNQYTVIGRVSGGRIVVFHEYIDSAPLLKALGVAE